jgi:hypothetical protein
MRKSARAKAKLSKDFINSVLPLAFLLGQVYNRGNFN